MCAVGAFAAALFVVSAAAAGAEYYGQQQQAKAQNKFLSAQARNGADLARQSFDAQIQQANARDVQAEHATSQQMIAEQTQAAKAKGTAQTAAGEANVAGLSVDALMSEYDQIHSGHQQNLRQGLDLLRQQSYFDRLGIRAGVNQHLSSLNFAPIRGPSAAVLGGQVAGAGLNDWSHAWTATHPRSQYGDSSYNS